MSTQDPAGRENVDAAKNQFSNKDGNNKLQKMHTNGACYVANCVRRHQREERPERHEREPQGMLETLADLLHMQRLFRFKVFVKAQKIREPIDHAR